MQIVDAEHQATCVCNPSTHADDSSLLNLPTPHFAGVLLSAWQDALHLLDRRDHDLHRHLQALPINVGASSIDDVKGKAEGEGGGVGGFPWQDALHLLDRRDHDLHRHLQALPINVGASSIDDVNGKAEGEGGGVGGFPMCEIQRVVEG